MQDIVGLWGLGIRVGFPVIKRPREFRALAGALECVVAYGFWVWGSAAKFVFLADNILHIAGGGS